MEIAVLGLGIIGSIWARNLVESGYEVKTWNRTYKEFPGFKASAEEAVSGTSIVFIVVSDPAAVQDVIDQILPALSCGQIVVQCSTISARYTKIFADQVTSVGASYLEAPFTGSKPAAEVRKTVFYVGGDLEVLEKARPVLQSIASEIMYIGELGTASTLKLAMNLNMAGIGQILNESLSLARAGGISDETYFNALDINAGKSGLSELKKEKLRSEDYSPQFSTKHMAKDLKLADETATEFSVPLRELKNLIQIYEAGIAAGYGEDDFIGLGRLVQK